MSWLKRSKCNNEQTSRTIDLRNKRSIFGTKKKKDKDFDKSVKCALCHKTINDEPQFCNQYLTRSKLCNAGPFCSEKCWEEHMNRVSHY